MFLGRKTTGKNVIEEMSQSKYPILADPKAQVYAATSFLEKTKYLHRIPNDGKEKIRTSNLEPIIETFDQFNLPYNEKIIKIFGKALNVFPKFVGLLFSSRGISLRGKEWSVLFDILFSKFLDDLAGLAYGEKAKELLKGKANLMVEIRKGFIASNIFNRPYYDQKKVKKIKHAAMQLTNLEYELLNSLDQEDRKELSVYNINRVAESTKNAFGLTTENIEKIKSIIKE